MKRSGVQFPWTAPFAFYGLIVFSMKVLIALVLLFAISNINAKASDFDSLFKEEAKNRGVLKDFYELQQSGRLDKSKSIEDRIAIGNVQLSFEKALSRCLKDKECYNARIIIQAPLPSTPLRSESKNIGEVSGTKNKQINDVLLARKDVLTNCAQYDSRIVVSYKKDGTKAINYEKYQELLVKNDAFIDCKGCYNFFDKIYDSGAWYKVNTVNNKIINFTIRNSQLKENNPEQIFSIRYTINDFLP